MRPGTTAIILEDDCMLYEGVTASAVVGAAPAPSTVTIRMFGYHSWAVHGPAPAATSADTITPWSTLATDYAGSTVGYAIPYAAAAALLTYFDARGITKGIDTAIRDACADAASGVTMDALVLCWSPWCRNGATDDSDIQFAPFVPVVPDFVFHAHCDSMDGDIQCVGSKPVLELAAMARVTPGCTAFNTLGYLKRAVTLPLVRPPCFAASALTGIWVRKQAEAPPASNRQYIDCCNALKSSESASLPQMIAQYFAAAATAWLEPDAYTRVRDALHVWDRTTGGNPGFDGSISFTATKYAALAARVLYCFPTLASKQDASCVEIGGGLGGGVVALAALFPTWTFAVLDLPDVARCCSRVVEACGLSDRVRCLTLDQWLGGRGTEAGRQVDLVVSEHAWSECSAPVRQAYTDNVFTHCTHGLLSCNLPDQWDAMQASIQTAVGAPVTRVLQRHDTMQMTWNKDASREQRQVWAYLQGGTGNQLYIAAHAVAFAALHGVPFERVHLSTAVHGPFEVSALLAGRFTTDRPPATAVVVREQGFAYDQARWQWPKGAEVVVLHGYFQQFLCCAPALPAFREFIGAAIKAVGVSRDVFGPATAASVPRIAMHIRRGDYTALAHVYHQLGPAYYTRALSKCPAEAALVVFSDDVPWCRSQAWIAALRPLVQYVDLPPAQALVTMAQCEYHVVANSTFSCWGAILAHLYSNRWPREPPSAVVVAPSEFYQPAASGLSSHGIPWPSWILVPPDGSESPSSSTHDDDAISGPFHLVSNYGLRLNALPMPQAVNPAGPDPVWKLPDMSSTLEPHNGGICYRPGAVDVLEVIPVMGHRADHLKGVLLALQRASGARPPLSVVVHVVVQHSVPEDPLVTSALELARAANAASFDLSKFVVMVTTVQVPPTPLIFKTLLMNIGVALAPPCTWAMFRDVDFWVSEQYYTAVAAVIAAADCPPWWYPRPQDMTFLSATEAATAAWNASGRAEDLLAGAVVTELSPKAPGGAVAVRGDVFWAVGGFAHQWFAGYASEDTEFARAVHKYTGVAPAAAPAVPTATTGCFLSVHQWHPPSNAGRDAVSTANHWGKLRHLPLQCALLRDIKRNAREAAWGAWCRVDKVVVLNLESRPDRLRETREELLRAGVPAWYRFAACRPTLEQANAITDPSQLWAEHCTSPSYIVGQAGCRESHRRIATWLWKTDTPCGLVLEDDTVFNLNGLHGSLRACLQRGDWDLLYLYTNPVGVRYKDGEESAPGPLRHVTKALTTSAMLFRPAASRILALYLQQARCEVDTALCRLQADGKLRCAVSRPFAAHQRTSYSDILGREVTYVP
jgi:hypothetical protein